MTNEKEIFPGAFLSLEGADGAGKTSNLEFLAQQVRSLGYEVVITRQPGGSITAEKIRHLVLGEPHTEEPMHAIPEALLFGASRAQAIHSVIMPAMREGKVVISDRFADSTFAYQGRARGQEFEVRMIEKIVDQWFEPDFTLFLSLSLETSLERLRAREKEYNRLNAQDIEFRTKCFEGYQQRFALYRYRMVEINAERPLEEVREQISNWVRHRFQDWMLQKTMRAYA
jgi:dTMP kinase